jgi:general secretion pathway protein F
MALFYYKALTAENKTVEGQMEATSEQTVASKLQEMGYFPISMQAAGITSDTSGHFFAKGISQDDVLLLTQKLAVILKAGLTLDAAMSLLIETAESPKLKVMLEKVTLSIHNGVSLSDAFEQHSSAFDRFYLNTLRAGETAGTLDLVLSRLATHLEHSRGIKKKIQAALIYPAVLVSVAILTLLILLVYVVPQFQALFADMGQELPFATQVVIAVADGIKQYGWIAVILIVGFILLIKSRLADSQKRRSIDQFVLRMPLVSKMVIRLEVARFSRTLATLLGNGVPVLAALNVVGASLNNTVIRELVEGVKDSVQQGRGVAAALLKQPLFPPMAIQLIRVGEETGELTPMLEQVADIYDEELSDSIQRFLMLLEPLLIIGLGIVIAAIIISVLLAILALNDFAV